MDVTHLSIKNFRKYESLELDFCKGVNVIFGENGLGKTTILEALFLCTCARSHKTSRDKDLIRHGAKDYSISVDFTSEAVSSYEEADYLENLELIYCEAGSPLNLSNANVRQIKYNSLKLDKIADLMGVFNAVIFCPEDIMLVKDAPAVRRRFLDMLISRIDKKYFYSLQMYNAIMVQRNKLLKQLRENLADGSQNKHVLYAHLDAWSEQFVAYAAYIIKRRLECIDILTLYAGRYHAEITENKEDLQLSYKSSFNDLDSSTELEVIEDMYRQLLHSVREEEVFRGSCQHGPHRDEFQLDVNAYSLKTFGSQGQQRTAVLALKLAELNIIRDKNKEMPVLLLDDVLPELDEGRRLSLMNSFAGAQVFITCTDVEEVHDKMQALLAKSCSRSFRVSKNSVEML